MNESYHYPPEIFSLLVDTIPLLCRSKRDLLVFFRGAGLSEELSKDLTHRVEVDSSSIYKHEIARTLLQRINERGDKEIRVRREVVKRVIEYEDFSACWPDDQLKAKGLVAELRRVVNVKDSFTRMAQERERERQESKQKASSDQETKRTMVARIELVKTDLMALFALEDQPQARGKHLERVLNELFRAYGVLIREDFRRADVEGAGVIEQIDGVIEMSGFTYLVEMKWIKSVVGTAEISPHLVRVYGRADTRALFIASNGYAATAIAKCREALAHKVIALITLEELVLLLERQGDLVEFLQKKVRAAVVDKNPYLEILNGTL